jgi:enoyl-CoA hydratase
MFPAYDTLIVSQPAPHVAQVAFNRPDAANALSRAMGEELTDCFKIIFNKSKDYRVVVLTGQGRHFCAGADLKERKGMDEAAWHAQHHAFETALEAVLSCPMPVIAAINGAAFGGGLELALACDFIYASAAAKFGLPETALGIMPGLGGTQTLLRAVGNARAKELVFSGKTFSAEDALAWGMVNRVCAPDALLRETIDTASAIAANAPLAVAAVKRAARDGMALSLNNALASDLRYYRELLATKDRHEGVNAFNEKRKPSFTGT